MVLQQIPPTLGAFALSGIAAFASHIAYLRRDPSPWTVLSIYGIIALSSPAVIHFHFEGSVRSVIYFTLQICAVYTAVLCISIGFYRLFLHQLCKFRGPTLLALTKFASVPMDARGHRPRVLTKLHRQYGDIVRIGPRELSINDTKVITAVLGAKSKCIKGPWYLAAHGGKGERALSLHVTIDPSSRRARRRIWDKAFSVKALNTYEDTLRQYTDAVMERIDEKAKKNPAFPVDEWCMFFSFDIMGQIGFSKTFDMISKGKFSNEITLLEGFMSAVMVLGNVPYMSEIARLLPNPLQLFDDYTDLAVRERLELESRGDKSEIPDIFNYLLDVDEETGWKHTRKELQADAGLIIVAGSDTSSSTLTLALFNLALRPNCLARLRQELAKVFPPPTTINNFQALSKECVYLNAVIDETLRLHPPVASGVQRQVPNDSMGISIAMRDGTSVVLPAGTVVSVPTTLMHRDERNFSPHPDLFRPERWLAKEQEEAFNPSAFIPFGFGPSGCVGKQLAYMEMRIFLAHFVMRFDFSLPPDFRPAEFLENIADTFTMTRHQSLRLRIQPLSAA